MKIKTQMIEKDKFAKNVYSKIANNKKKRKRERERKKEKQSLVTRKWVAK